MMFSSSLNVFPHYTSFAAYAYNPFRARIQGLPHRKNSSGDVRFNTLIGCDEGEPDTQGTTPNHLPGSLLNNPIGDGKTQSRE